MSKYDYRDPAQRERDRQIEAEAESNGWGVLVATLIILAVTMLGAWLFVEIDKSKKAQECMESRRRNCTIIQGQ